MIKNINIFTSIAYSIIINKYKHYIVFGIFALITFLSYLLITTALSIGSKFSYAFNISSLLNNNKNYIEISKVEEAFYSAWGSLFMLIIYIVLLVVCIILIIKIIKILLAFKKRGLKVEHTKKLK